MSEFKGILSNSTDIAVCISFNTLCNLKCPYCFAPKTAKVCLFNFSQAKAIVDLVMKYNGSVTFLILGGEPLLYPRLKDIMLHMLSYSKCNIELYTNGTIPIFDKVPVSDRITVVFSLHGTELVRTKTSHIFINNVNLYSGRKRVEVSMFQTKKNIAAIDTIITKLDADVYPNFIHINEVTEPIKFKHKLNEVPLFLDNNHPVAYTTHKCFTGWQCNLNGFSIDTQLNISRGCLGVVGNLSDNPNFFKSIKDTNVICSKGACTSSCLMQHQKLSYTSK